MIRGIGPVYAKKLARIFGDKVFDVIEAQPERLREVEGIGPVRAGRIAAAWVDQKVVREIMVRPFPIAGRVGIRDFTFEACSGFTLVTARPVAQPPKAAFVTRLRSYKRRMPTRSCVICTFESPSRGGSGQPPRPRVMRGVPRGQREVSTGETTGGHLQSGHYLDTYANIDQGQRRRLPSLVAETAEEPASRQDPADRNRGRRPHDDVGYR